MSDTITKETTIQEVLQMNPLLAGVLKASGMECTTCSASFGETLEEAAAVHDIPLALLLTRLNYILQTLDKN